VNRAELERLDFQKITRESRNTLGMLQSVGLECVQLKFVSMGAHESEMGIRETCEVCNPNLEICHFDCLTKIVIGNWPLSEWCLGGELSEQSLMADTDLCFKDSDVDGIHHLFDLSKIYGVDFNLRKLEEPVETEQLGARRLSWMTEQKMNTFKGTLSCFGRLEAQELAAGRCVFELSSCVQNADYRLEERRFQAPKEFNSAGENRIREKRSRLKIEERGNFFAVSKREKIRQAVPQWFQRLCAQFCDWGRYNICRYQRNNGREVRSGSWIK
jgi:hypothetical protein